ncbi:MAG: DUF2318 domain-containing protein [Thermodesulfobacteriota bacterium]
MFLESNEEGQASKRALVLSDHPRTYARISRALAVILVLMTAGAIFFIVKSLKEDVAVSRIGPDEGPASAAGEVSYPETDFLPGRSRHYSLTAPDGVKIRYFLVRDNSGVIRAAFDACDVCWRAGLGYVQEGQFMICRNCGQRFPLSRINEVKGGCNPAPLERRIENGLVKIKTQDILSGRSYFASFS